MASYIDGGAIASFSTAMVLYQEPLGISTSELGTLLSLLTFGIAIGAAIGGRLGDKFGRRPVFLVTVSFVVIGLVILIVAQSLPLLLIAAALVGFGAGADLPVSIATIAEAASDKNRGALVSFSQTLWFAAQIVTTVLTLFVGSMGRLGGQILFGHVAVVGIAVLILRFSIPESTEWSAARDERNRGVKTLRAERVGIKAVLTNKIFLLPFLALLAFYTLTNIGSLTTNQYAAYIAVNIAGTTVQGLSVAGLIGGLPVGIICALLFMRLADTRFRMPAFLVGCAAWMLSFLVPVVFGFSFTTLVFVILFGTIGGGLAFEAIMRVWSQENFPTLMRATVQGSVIAFGRAVAAVSVLLAPIFLTQPRLLFLILGVLAAIGLAVGYLAFRKPRFNAFALEDEPVEQAEGDAAAARLA
jgi:inositol transporter-like SP family MFS transporter